VVHPIGRGQDDNLLSLLDEKYGKAATLYKKNKYFKGNETLICY
jgi:hypothetical protein